LSHGDYKYLIVARVLRTTPPANSIGGQLAQEQSAAFLRHREQTSLGKSAV
jgi:hypothetical protein